MRVVRMEEIADAIADDVCRRFDERLQREKAKKLLDIEDEEDEDAINVLEVNG